ncbi:MAG TPA: alpha/beta hydrolase [Solirubrobacteraceae bacterium]|nr:alpha/beta hydrolase [Solirubrobacteraceae bacterium]
MTPRLDPDAQALLEVIQAGNLPQPYELPLDRARESARSALVSRGAPPSLHHVEDLALPTPHGPLTLRLYRPAAGPLPTALFLHGGGWVLNDLDTHDRLCRLLAGRSGVMLAALHYRRAPEHRHPAALEDAHLAYRWLLDNATAIGAEPGAVALVGESSGAATAACLSVLLRDLGVRLPSFQLLVYPVADDFGGWPSCERYASGYTLDAGFARWALDSYLSPGQDRRDPYLFPLAAPDLGGLPATLVVTAEFDPLRDEGVAYAQRLAAEGVVVEHRHVGDQMHGFLLLDRAIAKVDGLIGELAAALAGGARSPA